MLWSRAVATQPENAFYAAQVEPFGNFIVFRKRLRGDSYRARRCSVSRRRIPNVALWLIKELEPEMWTEFKRTQRQTEFNRALINVGDSCSLRITESSDGNLYGLKERTDLSCPEHVMRKQCLSGFVKFDAIPNKLGQ